MLTTTLWRRNIFYKWENWGWGVRKFTWVQSWSAVDWDSDPGLFSCNAISLITTLYQNLFKLYFPFYFLRKWLLLWKHIFFCGRGSPRSVCQFKFKWRYCLFIALMCCLCFSKLNFILSQTFITNFDFSYHAPHFWAVSSACF